MAHLNAAWNCPQQVCRARTGVRAFGRLGARDLAKMGQGLTIDGVVYEPIQAVIEPARAAKMYRPMRQPIIGCA